MTLDEAMQILDDRLENKRTGLRGILIDEKGDTAVRVVMGRIVEAQALVNTQAEDEGLWFQAEHAPEAYLQQELQRLHAVVEEGDKVPWEDAPLPEDDEIEAAHPIHTNLHATYAEARRLVSARRSKKGLIELVHWLLVRINVVDVLIHGLAGKKS